MVYSDYCIFYTKKPSIINYYDNWVYNHCIDGPSYINLENQIKVWFINNRFVANNGRQCGPGAL
jgi:hypothetical protein